MCVLSALCNWEGLNATLTLTIVLHFLAVSSPLGPDDLGMDNNSFHPCDPALDLCPDLLYLTHNSVEEEPDDMQRMLSARLGGS